MQNPLEITFKDIEHKPKIEKIIHEKFEKIQGITRDITKCHIILEALSKHHQKGNAYSVKLDLKLPHFSDIIVTEESKLGDVPLATAVRSVFKKAHELVRKEIDRHRERAPRPDKEGEV